MKENEKNTNELLSPKADVLAKLDYNRIVETSAKSAKIKLALFRGKEKEKLVYLTWIWLGARF
jgi:hypothetical protein